MLVSLVGSPVYAADPQPRPEFETDAIIRQQ